MYYPWLSAYYVLPFSERFNPKIQSKTQNLSYEFFWCSFHFNYIYFFIFSIQKDGNEQMTVTPMTSTWLVSKKIWTEWQWILIQNKNCHSPNTVITNYLQNKTEVKITTNCIRKYIQISFNTNICSAFYLIL